MSNGLPRGHAWDGLDPVLVRLITTSVVPGGTYMGGTVVLRASNGHKRGAASGFVLRAGPLPPVGLPEFFLVTARHVVLESAAYNLNLETLIIRDYDARKPIQDRISLPLDPTLWMHNDDSDVSMMRFSVDALPDDHGLTAIPVEELAHRKFGVMLPQGAELAVYGRWSVAGGADIPIRRNVTLASFEQPKAALEIGGARQMVTVYLADGTVSRGMSGGPVTYHAGGWGGSAVIGLIHGYAPLDVDDVAIVAECDGTEERARAWADVRRSLAAINSGMIYVVPIVDVEPLLAEAGFGYKHPEPAKTGEQELPAEESS